MDNIILQDIGICLLIADFMFRSTNRIIKHRQRCETKVNKVSTIIENKWERNLGVIPCLHVGRLVMVRNDVLCD